MKFLVIKDPHFRFGFSNQIRKNYERDIINKLDQLGEYAVSNNIKYLLIPGDVFDESYSERWRFSYYQKNIEILRNFIEKYNLRIISIAGNHDYFNGFENFWNTSNIGNSEITLTTVYGEAVKQGLLTDVSFPDTKVNFPNTKQFVSFDNIIVTGIKYYTDLNKVKEKLSIINDMNKNKDKIVITMLHQNVTPEDVNHITQFTYDYLSKEYPNIDVFILGHYHIGYEPVTINNTLFINPYNFTRVNREYEVRIDKHIPEFVELSIDNKINVSQNKFKATLFDDAFVEDYKVMQKIKQEISGSSDLDLDLSIDEMNSMNDFQILSLVAKKENISEKAIEFVIKKSEEL